jgi:ribonucleoside-diphosphate reductase alpha chain
MRHRPVGLGIMGFHDALYMMDINFDSEEAIAFADESMELISYHAYLSSSELARERGAYTSFKGSKWDRGIFPIDTLDILEKERGVEIPTSRSGKLDWSPVKNSVKQFGIRNSNCLAMAPTATISNIAGCVPTIEPIYKNIYVKSNMNGEFIIINPYLVADLKKENLWDFEMIGLLKYHDGSVRDIPSIPHNLKNKYKEVFEIDPSWLIRSAAHRGKWVDQSQSLNIYFAGTSGKELANIYEYAWKAGLKTTYYLRSLGASQVEKSTVNTAEYGATHRRNSTTTNASSVNVSSDVMVTGTQNVTQFVTAQAESVSNENIPSTEKLVPSMLITSNKKEETVMSNKVKGNYKITVMPEATCDGCQ